MTPRPRLLSVVQIVLALSPLLVALPAAALEPNDTFPDTTFLAPEVMTVTDDLGVGGGSMLDTYLGAFDESGALIASDDDSSPLGDGLASALSGIAVNGDGSIELAVTGFPDTDFTGAHSEMGGFEMTVDVFDVSGALVGGDSFPDVLVPGTVNPYSLFDTAWAAGGFTFDATIDNTTGPVTSGDVDFWAFTGLPAGADFVSEVTFGDFDSVLGWFDSTGSLITSDDDSGAGLLSLIGGEVPADGTLVLAVTGFDDFGFVGLHSEVGAYTLEVALVPEPTSLSLLLLAGVTAACLRRRAA